MPKIMDAKPNENTNMSGGNMQPSDPSPSIAVGAQAGFLLVVMLSSIIGNILILLAIYRNRSLRSITSVFVANLAVADLLLAILGMPFTMASSITHEWIFGDAWCEINGIINSVFCVASMLSLAAVSIDRYFAIMKPLHYITIMTSKTASYLVAGVWAQSILCAFLPIFGWASYTYIRNESICTADWGSNIPYTLFIFGLCFFAPLSVMAYCYYHILRAARKQSKNVIPVVGELREDTLRTVVAITVAYAQKDGNSVKIKESPREREAKEKFKRETKAAKTLLIVMGTFLFCWAPHFIGMTCLLFPSCKWSDEFFATTTWLAMANSGCNPIIYGVMNKKFRQSFKEILCCGRKQRNDRIASHRIKTT